MFSAPNEQPPPAIYDRTSDLSAALIGSVAATCARNAANAAAQRRSVAIAGEPSALDALEAAARAVAPEWTCGCCCCCCWCCCCCCWCGCGAEAVDEATCDGDADRCSMRGAGGVDDGGPRAYPMTPPPLAAPVPLAAPAPAATDERAEADGGAAVAPRLELKNRRRGDGALTVSHEAAPASAAAFADPATVVAGAKKADTDALALLRH
jgi:hypothetical protein